MTALLDMVYSRSSCGLTVLLLGVVKVGVVQTVDVVDGGLDEFLQVCQLIPGRVLEPGCDPGSF